MLSRLPVALRAGVLTLVLGAVAPAYADESPAYPVVFAQASDDESTSPVEPQNDAAALTVRVDRLEGTIRSLTGQVEQLQFQNRKLTDDLRKMQQDVDFRFQDLNRVGVASAPVKPTVPARRSDVDALPGSNGLPQDASEVEPPPAVGASIPPKQIRRTSDAFDPDANPGAPGVPRPLGTTSVAAGQGRSASTLGSSPPSQPSAPLELMKRPAVSSGAEASTENGVAATTPPALSSSTDVARPAPNSASVASLVPGGTREEFISDLDLYKQGQYDGAASGLKSFLDKYPRDRMVPDAVYMLGEAYTKLGRHREAAEQYLRLSTDFSKAPRAPDALLRLGMSLNAMGVREQACATYQEVTRRFPAASTDVRAAVDRELKRARC